MESNLLQKILYLFVWWAILRQKLNFFVWRVILRQKNMLIKWFEYHLENHMQSQFQHKSSFFG